MTAAPPGHKCPGYVRAPPEGGFKRWCGQGFFEGFGFFEAFLPGLAAGVVEVFGGFEVVGLAGAVWGVVHQGAVHGGGVGEETELALVVGAAVFGAEVDLRAFDEARFGEGFSAAEVEVDQGHGFLPSPGPRARCAGMSVRWRICARNFLVGIRRSFSQQLTVEGCAAGIRSWPKSA